MDQTLKFLELIAAAIDDYNADIPDVDHLAKTSETILFSPDGKLDSVGFVTLSTAIEARILKTCGRPFPLFTPGAMNHPDQPLRTVGSLAAYLADQLK